mmetsp:Transcript_33489/g.99822  ORF Transcript_33489/g.99822 Transcript_33489/m.99822 type:complete len:101 (-) Transcript_33489:3332-3634(-)
MHTPVHNTPHPLISDPKVYGISFFPKHNFTYCADTSFFHCPFALGTLEQNQPHFLAHDAHGTVDDHDVDHACHHASQATGALASSVAADACAHCGGGHLA